MSWLRRLALSALFALSLAPAFAQAPGPVPALPDSERRTAYSLSGTNCACSVGFALYGDTSDYWNWVEVYLNGVALSYNDPNLGWTITSPSGSLGLISRPITDAILTFTAPQTGTVQIVGARRPRRVSQFTENRGVAARDLNQTISDIVAMLREDWDKINDVTGRGLFFAPGNVTGPMPSPTNCVSAYLAFDATGLNPQCVTPLNLGNLAVPGSVTANDVVGWGANSHTLIDLGPFRARLTTNKNYFVNWDSGASHPCGATGALTCLPGSDFNNGLSQNTPFQTLQKALNVDFTGDDLNLNAVNIFLAQTAAGPTYDNQKYHANCILGPTVGSSVINIVGNTSNYQLTRIQDQNSGYGLQIKDLCTIDLSGVDFVDSPSANAAGHIVVGGSGNAGHLDMHTYGMEALAGAGATGLTVGSLGSATATGPIGVNGNMPVAFGVTSPSGQIDFSSQIVTGLANLTFSTAFAYEQDGGQIKATPTTFQGFAGVAGTQCLIDGPTAVNGANPNTIFPGSVPCVPKLRTGNIALQSGAGGQSYDFGSGAGWFLQSGGSSGIVDSWAQALTPGQALTPANNLSDVSNIVTARANIGIAYPFNGGAPGPTTSNSTQYIGQSNLNNTETSVVPIITPVSYTVKNLTVYTPTAPGGVQTYVVTLRKNLADTALTCTITGVSTSCQDLTHSVSVSADNTLDLKIVSSATAATTLVSWSVSGS